MSSKKNQTTQLDIQDANGKVVSSKTKRTPPVTLDKGDTITLEGVEYDVVSRSELMNRLVITIEEKKIDGK